LAAEQDTGIIEQDTGATEEDTGPLSRIQYHCKICPRTTEQDTGLFGRSGIQDRVCGQRFPGHRSN